MFGVGRSGWERVLLGNGSGDADICYMLLRDLKPAPVFEVGSGFASALMARALAANRHEGRPGRLVSIDPHPHSHPRRRDSTRDPDREVIVSSVETVPTTFFEELEGQHVLFIDSTHTVRVGGDVVYLVLEVLPRLRPGVYVRFHDIFLPDAYPRQWVVRELRFWAEQYLLQAFLAFNRLFQVVWPGYYMHKHHPALLKACLPSYRPIEGVLDFPVSFWMQRVP